MKEMVGIDLSQLPPDEPILSICCPSRDSPTECVEDRIFIST